MVKLLARIVPPLPNGYVVSVLVLVLGLLSLAITSGTAAGQFASHVSLVEVYATVTDSGGRPMKGLRAADFAVEEDGARQSIQTFAAGRFPLSVAVAVDRSFSMSDRALAASVTATRAFAERLTPDDQLMVIGIGSDTEVLAPLSKDRAIARRALERLARWGTTPLFDAVIQAIDAVQPAPGRRALILLSDGEDRYSLASGADVVAYARQHDVLVYPVSLGESRATVWSDVASVSGGRAHVIRNPRELEPTLTAIAEELRGQYLIGYAPAADGREGWRAIRVRVSRAGAQVRARDGYFASGR